MHEKVQKRFFIVDGYSYLFRAYHSMPPLTDPEGTPVGGVYGFTNMLTKLKNRVHTSNAEEIYMLVALDAGRKTFRNDIYPEYKANRPEPPEDLRPQFPLIRDAAEALNIETLDAEGYEADDIIATYTKLAEQEDCNVVIVSSDKDLMQLVSEHTTMYDPMRDKVIGKEQVHEKFGVYPDRVLDLLSLIGDSIDNIPGIPGIGPKTAAQLLEEYDDLEGVLSNAENIKQNKRRETIIENKDNALLSRELAKLNYEVPVNKDIGIYKIKDGDVEKAFNFFNKHGFKSLIKNLEKNNPEKLKNIEIKEQENDKNDIALEKNDFNIIGDENDLKKYNNIKTISIYPYEEEGNLELISLAINEEGLLLITPNNQEVTSPISSEQEDLFGLEKKEEKKAKKIINNFDYFFKTINEYTQNSEIDFIFYNLKYFLNKKLISPPYSYVSIHSIYYCLNGVNKEQSISSIAEKELSLKIENEKELIDLEKDKKQKKVANYSYILAKISKKLKNNIFNNKLNYIFYEIDNKLIPILSEMELAGIKIDKNILDNLSDNFEKKIALLEKEIHQIAGEEFNIGSPKQLGEVLFEHMGIQGGKKTKTGQYKTDFDKLEELAASGHDIAEKILEWRSLSKLTNTYTKALVKEINKETGRVHTNFHITTTTTGRLSSSNPNLQNIPIRTKNGREIRKAFVAEDGKKLIGADYSQIELRLLAHMADIKVLKDAFKHGEDIHKATAAQVFGADIDKVDADMRRAAKTVNFGIIYGQSAFGLAKSLRIGRKEAKEIIDKYFEQYPGIKKYMDETIMFAKEHEFVNTLWGRKIFLKGINDKNHNVRSFAERAAINAPLQGTAADIIKMAMIKVDRELKQNFPHAKILLQIHDELIIECDEENAQKASELVKNTMENVIRLNVPLIVDSNTGNHWGEIH